MIFFDFQEENEDRKRANREAAIERKREHRRQRIIRYAERRGQEGISVVDTAKRTGTSARLARSDLLFLAEEKRLKWNGKRGLGGRWFAVSVDRRRRCVP